MAYISETTVKGHVYFRLIESYRHEGHIKHRIIKNYSRTPPDGYTPKALRPDHPQAQPKVSAKLVSAMSQPHVSAKLVSATAIATTVDFQIAVRKWAAETNETPDEYLARFAARKKNPLASNHDPTGQKRY